MLKHLVLASILAAALAAPAGYRAGNPRLIPVTSGSCVAMSPDPSGTGFILKNTCNVCRTALVSWCDGEAHMFDVRGNGATHIDACRGFQTLLSDAPCQHR